jgi:cytidine deaminase
MNKPKFTLDDTSLGKYSPAEYSAAVEKIAIAAREPNGNLTAEPVSPCGTCRQVLIETETRFQHPIRILLYGRNRIYVMDGIRHLMPLSFTEF